jgi:DNA-binding winged helix-turn-helix (wHTH) protein/tetratricopeptide (TPR) repeat protein
LRQFSAAAVPHGPSMVVQLDPAIFTETGHDGRASWSICVHRRRGTASISRGGTRPSRPADDRYNVPMVDGDIDQSQWGDIAQIRAPIILSHEHSFRIADIEIHPSTREVRFASESAIIEPRVMQMLIALRRANGAVVNKDDLMQSCWEGRIVGEDAINRVVSRLRSVAEKSGRQFRIETVTKVGYRLVLANGGVLQVSREAPTRPAQVSKSGDGPFWRRTLILAAAGLLAVVVAVGAWLWIRPAPATAHSMMVRLSGFRVASIDLPAAMLESINAEVIAAFNVDGVIGVSMEPRPAPGTAPAYALGGTIYRVGGSTRVITRLTNERSGVVLWSDSVDYTADQTSRIPHKIAVDAGTVIRCGLSGAATYKKPLPDPVMSNYMQYCQEYWAYGGSKTLRFAQRVVAEVPDFSWGWSAVENGYTQAAAAEPDKLRAEAMRIAGLEAADKALALDSRNSEALAHKAYLIDQRDLVGQMALLKSAVDAKPLDCGCEHFGYGLRLQSVGRVSASIEQIRAATNMLALWPDSQFALGRTLAASGQVEESRPFFEAAIALSKDPHFDKRVAVNTAMETGDYDVAATALNNPAFKIPAASRVALLKGYAALASGASQAKLDAVQALLVLPKGEQTDVVVTMLGALGANREALHAAAERPWLFWRRSMRGILSEPDFPAVAKQAGLMTYWKTSRTKPDVCQTTDAPRFCSII